MTRWAAAFAATVAAFLLASSSSRAAVKCPAPVLFIGHGAGYWHQQYLDALRGYRRADALPIRHPDRFTVWGCPASLSYGHGPGYWRHRLVVISQRARVAKLARHYIGVPYLFGGDGPGGFDCSGLVEFVYRQSIGLVLPRTTFTQWVSRLGRPVSRRGLRTGDVVFFYPTPSGPEHAGIYLGAGRFIDAPHSGARVRVNVLAYYPQYAGARRFIR